MENSEIKYLLTAFNLNPENDAVKSFFERDNIWKILDIQRYEPSHSAFLVWFFSQKMSQSPHLMYLLNLLVSKADERIISNGWNDTDDMKAFVNAILTGSYSIKTVSVFPEVVINKLSKMPDSDRLDVFIRCALSIIDNSGNEQEKTLEIIIENKVDSSEGKEKVKDLSKCPTEYQRLQQTERYYYACSKEHKNRLKNNVDYQFFAFLTPDRKPCRSDNYILISYQDLVDNVFENYLKRKDVEASSRSLIEAYLHNLGNPYNKNNKEIIAMDTEERNLLVDFYNRNKSLFEVTIQAMMQQATKDGDEESAKEFEKVAIGLKKAGTGSRFYQINGDGRYSMRQVIEEYIKYKLDAGTPFAKISPIKGMFMSEDPKGVSIGSRKDAKPYSFNHNGKDYYVTTELRDKESKDNFRRFRTIVNSVEPGFNITPITV